MQRHIVCRALELGAEMMVPATIVDLDLRWRHDEWKSRPLSWNRAREDAGSAAPTKTSSTSTPRAAEPADTRTPRLDVPQYQTDDDRRAAEAVDHEQQCLTCIGLQHPNRPIEPTDSADR